MADAGREERGRGPPFVPVFPCRLSWQWPRHHLNLWSCRGGDLLEPLTSGLQACRGDDLILPLAVACSQPKLGSICLSRRRPIPAPLAPATPGPLYLSEVTKC